ncbi:hypothetical protein Lal_00011717 [Lupinus albus]|uniref:Putative transcription factor C2H2 family n=1 Tax=Lupinus albus TaxID=3870 RepID=A0A6A4QD81_LUPAL|nr:putative transcription factor C2H2 family [Lupinus albus]KAF1880658.1 hypothetical protein Lal_00011717 [Lupinus albus]
MAASSSSASLFGFREEDQNQMNQQHSSSVTPAAPPQKKKRNQPGTPNPDAEVIALSPKTLMATNRFICEVCNKGFQREQNLQLHRRGHNLPWKLKQKSTKEPRRKVYLCPEPTCVHHDPSRALGDLTGIKKHYSRKHGEKKWKCDKCSKKYAVQSDWKAHSKTCGTREYRCDCGTLFSRRDSFITHRAFCDALAQESVRQPPNLSSGIGSTSHLYGSNNSNMALALSQVTTPQMSNMQDHINNEQRSAVPLDILGLGSNVGRTGQFDHILHPSLQAGSSSFKPSQKTMQNSGVSFFMAADNSNQNYHHHDQSQQQGMVQQNKDPFQGLMHLSHDGVNHHHNSSSSPGGSANFFNHAFLSSNTSTNSSNNSFSEQFNNANGNVGGGNEGINLFSAGNPIVGGGGHHQQTMTSSAPSLFSTSLQSNNSAANTHHMSATALLQKVAQMSAISSNSTNSLLKSFGSSISSSSGSKAEQHRPMHVPAPPPPPPSAANYNNIFGANENSNNNLQDLMNSFAASGNTSIFEHGGSVGLTGFEPYDHNANRREQPKLHGVNIGSSGSDDRLTRDFLGVGQIVRNMSGGSGGLVSQREQHGFKLNTTLETERNNNAVPARQAFGGGGGNFQ